MLTICDRLQHWEVNSYEKDRIEAGNHRVFVATEKSFLCPKCKRVLTFYIGSALCFCMECREEIPKADALLNSLDYRVAYHFGKENSVFLC